MRCGQRLLVWGWGCGGEECREHTGRRCSRCTQTPPSSCQHTSHPGRRVGGGGSGMEVKVGLGESRRWKKSKGLEDQRARLDDDWAQWGDQGGRRHGEWLVGWMHGWMGVCWQQPPARGRRSSPVGCCAAVCGSLSLRMWGSAARCAYPLATLDAAAVGCRARQRPHEVVVAAHVPPDKKQGCLKSKNPESRTAHHLQGAGRACAGGGFSMGKFYDTSLVGWVCSGGGGLGPGLGPARAAMSNVAAAPLVRPTSSIPTGADGRATAAGCDHTHMPVKAGGGTSAGCCVVGEAAALAGVGG